MFGIWAGLEPSGSFQEKAGDKKERKWKQVPQQLYLNETFSEETEELRVTKFLWEFIWACLVVRSKRTLWWAKSRDGGLFIRYMFHLSQCPTFQEMIRAILQSAEQFSISAYQRHMFLKFGVESFVVWCTSVVMFLSQKKKQCLKVTSWLFSILTSCLLSIWPMCAIFRLPCRKAF